MVAVVLSKPSTRTTHTAATTSTPLAKRHVIATGPAIAMASGLPLSGALSRCCAKNNFLNPTHVCMREPLIIRASFYGN